MKAIPLFTKSDEPQSSSIIHSFIRKAMTVYPAQRCSEVIEQFNAAPDHVCVVVCNESKEPIGLVMKGQLSRLQTQRFGKELFFERSITKLMDAQPLIVDWTVNEQELLDLALGREEKTLYDCVVIVRGGVLEGILTMSDLLKISRLLQERAVSLQVRSMSGAASMVHEIDHSVASVLQAARRGEELSEMMVDYTLQGKSGLTGVSSTFASISELTYRQVEQMRKLQERADSIGAVSKLIRELAEQCNLLAMNASIEAARAGEHGRGFAVVAGEVGKLATQTKRSANDIGGLISSILEEVNVTASLVEQSREEAVASESSVNQASGAFEQLFHAAVSNRSSAAQIGSLSDEAERQASRVVDELNKLIQGMQHNS